MNTNNGLPSGWTVMQQPKWKPYALQSLIDTKPYPTALAKLQKQKEDCGYTDKWYQDELRKMNKEWRNKVQSAIEENSRYIDEQRAEIAKVRATNFEHRYTECDYADLQFMQNLIKTRIAAEGQNNGVLIGRIVDDYINTQVGARAIMFLSGDSEVGKLLQDYYPRSAQNAKSAAELQFEKDKAAELDRLESALIPFLQANIIGGGMLKAAEERVTADIVKQGDELYFSDEADEDEKGKEKGYVYRPL